MGASGSMGDSGNLQDYTRRNKRGEQKSRYNKGKKAVKIKTEKIKTDKIKTGQRAQNSSSLLFSAYMPIIQYYLSRIILLPKPS